MARGSFTDLIEALSQREPVRQYSAAFRAAVDAALVNGRVLLLADGLDEIADPGDRAAFVCTLRSALQAYPGTGFVVTSREAGFRHVAAHLAPLCTQATLSPFDSDDIQRLCVSWHREVVGDTEKVRTDAEQLAASIAENDRINRLAVNPLLLTTLLLVKRWVGSLPTRRAVLYGKAVEVLLMTWNTEGHDPIPEEEALPQLCYVAAAMMLEKIERISRPRLGELIQQAREALPTELGYVQGSVEDFIHRVEDRSSLLMMTGHDVEDGRLVEFFEFRHLTFQEFLAARAMVEGWHPGRNETDTLADVLAAHFDDEKWREVIPLAAVLGGKATEALISLLTAEVARLDDTESLTNLLLLALANCLSDEANASRATIRSALRELVRFGGFLHRVPCSPMLVKGKYGADLREEARQAVLAATSNIANPADALLIAVYHQMLPTMDVIGYERAAKQSLKMLESPDVIVRLEGANCIGKMSHDLLQNTVGADGCRGALENIVPTLDRMLHENNILDICGAAYALEPIGASRIGSLDTSIGLITRLIDLWQRHEHKTVQNLALRALITQPFVPRNRSSFGRLITDDEFDSLWASYERLEVNVRTAVLLTAYYRESVNDAEIIERSRQVLSSGMLNPNFGGGVLRELLECSGAPVADIALQT